MRDLFRQGKVHPPNAKLHKLFTRDKSLLCSHPTEIFHIHWKTFLLYLLDPCKAPLTMSRWSFNSIFATILVRGRMGSSTHGGCLRKYGLCNKLEALTIKVLLHRKSSQVTKHSKCSEKLIQTLRWMQKRFLQSASRTFCEKFSLLGKFLSPFFIRTIVKCSRFYPGEELRINLHCKLSPLTTVDVNHFIENDEIYDATTGSSSRADASGRSLNLFSARFLKHSRRP